jgi:murein peptide amidase A
MPAHPLQHRCHDYKLLVQRWKTLAKQNGLRMKEFAKAGECPVYFVETRGAKSVDTCWRYISAGVHGDEAAPPWGLLEWAEQNTTLLQKQPFLIFPALNPNGLMCNTRADERGVDINRAFNSLDDPLVAAWRRAVGERRLSLGLCLHEDYDGQGCYLYELTRRTESIGDNILRDTADILPTDPRTRIDGRAAKNGLIARRVPPELPGHPEAIVLHYLGAPIALTFESPSEFCLTDRIAVQRRFIESALEHGCHAGESGRLRSGGGIGKLHGNARKTREP